MSVKKILISMIAVLMLVSCIGAVGCSTDPAPEQPESSSLLFAPNRISMEVGESVQTTLTGLAEGETVTAYSSNNQKVAKVDEHGNIEGLAAGNAVIKAVTDVGNSALVAVEVFDGSESGILSIGFGKSDIVLQEADTYLPDVTVTISGQPVEAQITWQSDREEVAAVSDGAIIALGEGNATLTATASYAEEQAVAKMRVTVLPASLSVCPDYERRVIYSGNEFPLHVSAMDGANAVELDVAYTSDNPNVAYIIERDGEDIFVAESGGDVTVTAKFMYGGEEYSVRTPLHVYGGHTVSIYALGYDSASRDSILAGKMYGDVITLSLKEPEAGREIKCWYVDGVRIEGNTFIMPDANVTAYAKYVNETEGDFTANMSDGSLFGGAQASAEFVEGELKDGRGETNTDGNYVRLSYTGSGGASVTFAFDESVIVSDLAVATVRMYVESNASVYFGYERTRHMLYAANASSSSESLKKTDIATEQWIEISFPLNNFLANGQLIRNFSIGVAGGACLIDYIMLKY